MKKKLLLSLISICIGIFPFCMLNASADISGYYTYTVSDNKATITDVDTIIMGDVSIPETLGGYTVIKIGTQAFYNCNKLTRITVPDSVMSIGDEAFSGCDELESINIPDGIKSIEGYVFYNCDSLTNITIPDSVTSIGFSAFEGCSKLTSVTIPDSVTSIGFSAFEGCSKLTSVTIPNGVTSIGDEAFSGCDELESINIPDGIKSIEDYVFYNCDSLTNITIPDSVTSIGFSAFEGCSKLTSVTIPKSVTSIYSGAFDECSSLKRVNITDIVAWCNIKFSNYTCNPLYYARLYINDSLVTELIIPDGVTTIGSYAFCGCYDLINVTIPNSVTTIGSYAFYNCMDLMNITISDSVTTIGDYAFNRCYDLTDITIPNSVTTIGSYAFADCIGLTSITIPDSVTTIGGYAFYNCSSLTRVDIMDIAAWCNIKFKTASGKRCSYGNPLYYAKKLYLNGSLVTNLTIPDGVSTIGIDAFYNCTSITSVTIPDSVTIIGSNSFENCTSLTSITIPDSVTTIGGYAFYNCSSLTSVNILDIAAWCDIEFMYYYSNPLHYAKKLYLNGSLVTNLTIPNSVINIGNSAFYNCDCLTSVTIPDSVTSIGSSAFYDCDGLTSVIIGSGVEIIQQSTFYSCADLKYVCIPEELLCVESDTFNGCTNIETVFYTGHEIQWKEVSVDDGNENLINANIVYKVTKKTYSFETNCGVTLLDITDYAVFTEPTVKNESAALIGWYDNVALEGDAVIFPYYGSETTLYAAWTDRTGLDFDDAFIAKENRKYTVTTAETGQIIYYEFVPKHTGEYRFYSQGSLDTYGYLYNSSQNQLVSNNDDGDGNNFCISYELTAGEKYYIAAKCYSGSGTFTFVIETDCISGTQTVCVAASSGEKIFISIPSYLPENSQVILACYKDDKFVEMRYTSNKNETIYFVINNEFDTAKVMVWETFKNMKPLCEAEIVK